MKLVVMNGKVFDVSKLFWLHQIEECVECDTKLSLPQATLPKDGQNQEFVLVAVSFPETTLKVETRKRIKQRIAHIMNCTLSLKCTNPESSKTTIITYISHA
ncbi:hypothetical protein Dsin_012156 [Dipteronia sinensis]|uniref:Uncharacterized protein n=1 Tax=Dipteronia sinensis TaxID=43782 RepID=A0AAE0AHJ7_9ROSI|nr:hypothetical protein Dsin_012156 [Dipteronia sinensis]